MPACKSLKTWMSLASPGNIFKIPVPDPIFDHLFQNLRRISHDMGILKPFLVILICANFENLGLGMWAVFQFSERFKALYCFSTFLSCSPSFFPCLKSLLRWYCPRGNLAKIMPPYTNVLGCQKVCPGFSVTSYGKIRMNILAPTPLFPHTLNIFYFFWKNYTWPCHFGTTTKKISDPVFI